jgi:hypothetical protein
VWAAAVTVDNWTIELETQPPNSPDSNQCDLTFFRALQADQWAAGFASTTEGLIEKVMHAWQHFDVMKINKGFITLQTCLNEILESDGGNDYKIPHMGKDRLQRLGQLPRRIRASPLALENANRFT